MRLFVIALFVAACSTAAGSDTVIRSTPRRLVIRTAQDAAVDLAARGVLVHTGCSQTEGIGFSTTSASDAVSRCCYWGRKTPTDIGVARGVRGWYAVVRYR
jgi:hypothetical protein